MVNQGKPPRDPVPRLPSLHVKGREVAKAFFAPHGGKAGGLPNAVLIYGVASAALAGIAIYHLSMGGWGIFLLLMLVAGALFGFALYYLRHAE